MTSNFPNPEYLRRLQQHLREKFERQVDTDGQVLAFTGGLLNWVGDFLTDPNVAWSEDPNLSIDRLTLTGTNPEWNKIVLEECERSPQKFRQRLQADPTATALFASATDDGTPILVRLDGEELKVLEGMHRVIAAVRDGRQTVHAFVAEQRGPVRPSCEPHVVYDLLRAYERNKNLSRSDLIAALRFLVSAYGNVETFLRERFSRGWLRDEEASKIVDEVLG